MNLEHEFKLYLKAPNQRRTLHQKTCLHFLKRSFSFLILLVLFKTPSVFSSPFWLKSVHHAAVLPLFLLSHVLSVTLVSLSFHPRFPSLFLSSTPHPLLFYPFIKTHPPPDWSPSWLVLWALWRFGLGSWGGGACQHPWPKGCGRKCHLPSRQPTPPPFL